MEARDLAGVALGARVSVHVNLQNGRLAICDARRPGGKVLAYADAVTLAGVDFRVSETVRERVIRFNRRRVHAFAIGTLVALDAACVDVDGVRVTYNPHRAATFTNDAGAAVMSAERVTFRGRYGYLPQGSTHEDL